VRLASALALAGGTLMMLGAFLDWSGVGYVPPWDRELAAAGGIMAAAAGTAALRWPYAVLLALPGALLGLALGIVNYRDVSERRYEFEAYPNASVGVGLYVVIAGTVLALAGVATAALIVLRSRPPRERGGEAQAHGR
jgi:hypothetical protein